MADLVQSITLRIRQMGYTGLEEREMNDAGNCIS